MLLSMSMESSAVDTFTRALRTKVFAYVPVSRSQHPEESGNTLTLRVGAGCGGGGSSTGAGAAGSSGTGSATTTGGGEGDGRQTRGGFILEGKGDIDGA